jgi:hypothetical protein
VKKKREGEKEKRGRKNISVVRSVDRSIERYSMKLENAVTNNIAK